MKALWLLATLPVVLLSAACAAQPVEQAITPAAVHGTAAMVLVAGPSASVAAPTQPTPAVLATICHFADLGEGSRIAIGRDGAGAIVRYEASSATMMDIGEMFFDAAGTYLGTGLGGELPWDNKEVMARIENLDHELSCQASEFAKRAKDAGTHDRDEGANSGPERPSSRGRLAVADPMANGHLTKQSPRQRGGGATWRCRGDVQGRYARQAKKRRPVRRTQERHIGPEARIDGRCAPGSFAQLTYTS